MFVDGTDRQRIVGRAVVLHRKPQATSWNYVGGDQMESGNGRKNGQRLSVYFFEPPKHSSPTSSRGKTTTIGKEGREMHKIVNEAGGDRRDESADSRFNGGEVQKGMNEQ